MTSKVLIKLEPAAAAYYILDNPPEFAGDFKISVNVVGSDLTSDQAIIDSSIFQSGAAGEILLYIDNPNGLDLLVCNGAGSFTRKTFGGQSAILNGDFNTVSLQRASGVVTALVNGVQLDGTFANTETIKFSQGLIGGGASRHFNGILSDLSLENIVTPANDLPFGLDELTANTEISNGVTATYTNIATTQDVRDTYTLSADGTQWVSDLRTIDIAAQA